MKKILTVLIAIVISSCKASDMAKLDEVSDLVFNKGYGEAEVLEIVNGVYYKDIAAEWGEPNGGLSGFWGDIWLINNDGKKKQIIVYYNSDGYAEHVIIDDIKTDNKNTVEQNKNLETDENGYYIDDDPLIYDFYVINDGLTSYGALEWFGGIYYEELYEHWGEPDGRLSGFWGDIWNIGNNKQMIVYYNSDGCVENVIIENIEANTDGNN